MSILGSKAIITIMKNLRGFNYWAVDVTALINRTTEPNSQTMRESAVP